MPIGGLQGALREGRAWFFEDGRYGFIDERAEVVLPPVLDEAADFYDGRALARRGGLYGYVDLDGREVVPCRYPRATTFCAGRAIVWDDAGRGWCIDRAGAVVAPCAAVVEDASGLWYEGRMRVRRGGLCGFVDVDGREVVPCRYDDAHLRFVGGLAGVRRGGLWGFVDGEGREVVPPRYASADPFREGDGTANVTRAEGYGLLAPDGRERVRCRFAAPVGPFREGLARVDLGPVVDPGRDGAGTLAYAQIGFVDERDVEVIPCRYESATDFEAGVSWVTTPERRARFAIDRAGREVAPVRGA